MKIVICGAIISVLLGLHLMPPVAILAHKVSSGGGPTFIQSCVNGGTTTTTSSASVTCASPVVAGDALLFSIANPVLSITGATLTGDSGTLTTSLVNNAGQSWANWSTWYVLSAGGGGSTLTLNAASSFYNWSLTVDEVRCPSTCHFEQANSVANGTGGTGTANSITTMHSNVFIWVPFIADYNHSPTAGSPFTIGSDASGVGTSGRSVGSEYYVKATAGSITPTVSWSGGQDWGIYALSIY